MAAKDPDGEAFEREFGPVFGAMRSVRGACPQSEQLAQFVAGVNASEVRALEEHIGMCGRCDAMVTRMRVVERTLSRQPWWGFVRKPTFAWAVAVLMTVVAAVYVRKAAATGPVVLRSVMSGFQTAEFMALREAQRGEGEALKVAGTQPTVVLGLAIPAQAGHRYSLRIVPWPDRTEPLTVSDATGWAYVTINRRDFTPGRYSCVVSELDGAGRDTGRVFEFRFLF